MSKMTAEEAKAKRDELKSLGGRKAERLLEEREMERLREQERTKRERAQRGEENGG